MADGVSKPTCPERLDSYNEHSQDQISNINIEKTA